MVHESLSAFILGRLIHDNIIFVQELVKGYNRKGISPRCMIQMDIQKAYDTVDWGALERIMLEMGFPTRFVKWIMVFTTSVSYIYLINGMPSSLVRSHRGVRQGILSPPAFCACDGISLSTID